MLTAFENMSEFATQRMQIFSRKSDLAASRMDFTQRIVISFAICVYFDIIECTQMCEMYLLENQISLPFRKPAYNYVIKCCTLIGQSYESDCCSSAACQVKGQDVEIGNYDRSKYTTIPIGQSQVLKSPIPVGSIPRTTGPAVKDTVKDKIFGPS